MSKPTTPHPDARKFTFRQARTIAAKLGETERNPEIPSTRDELMEAIAALPEKYRAAVLDSVNAETRPGEAGLSQQFKKALGRCGQTHPDAARRVDAAYWIWTGGGAVRRSLSRIEAGHRLTVLEQDYQDYARTGSKQAVSEALTILQEVYGVRTEELKDMVAPPAGWVWIRDALFAIGSANIPRVGSGKVTDASPEEQYARTRVKVEAWRAERRREKEAQKMKTEAEQMAILRAKYPGRKLKK